MLAADGPQHFQTVSPCLAQATHTSRCPSCWAGGIVDN
jgi:hypothetical protein